jgi:hypothetical protein
MPAVTGPTLLAQVTKITQFGDGANVTPAINIVSRNVNGVTLARPEIDLLNSATGAAVAWATLLNTSGDTVRVHVQGWFPE